MSEPRCVTGLVATAKEVVQLFQTWVDAGCPSILTSEEPNDWRREFEENVSKIAGWAHGEEEMAAFRILADRIERLEQGA